MLTDLRFADPLLALFVLLTVARTEGGRCAGATTRTSGRGDASLRGLPTFTRSSGFVSVDDLCCGGGVGVLDRGKLATSLVTDSDRIDPNVWSGDKLAPTLCTIPLTEPEVTKNGIGVGQGLNGELLTELRVLLNTECGHCGGPTCPPEDALPLLEERPFRQGIFDQPLTFFPDNPLKPLKLIL